MSRALETNFVYGKAHLRQMKVGQESEASALVCWRLELVKDDVEGQNKSEQCSAMRGVNMVE